MTGPVFAPAHPEVCGLRVIVRVDNTGAELNEQHGGPYRYHGPDTLLPLLYGNRNIIGAVIRRLCEIGRGHGKTFLGQPVQQNTCLCFQPALIAVDLPNGVINPGHRQGNFDGLHDTVTLLTA